LSVYFFLKHITFKYIYQELSSNTYLSGPKIINYIASDSYYFYCGTNYRSFRKVFRKHKGSVTSNFKNEQEFQRIAKAKYIYHSVRLEIKRAKKIYINLRNGK